MVVHKERTGKNGKNDLLTQEWLLKVVKVVKDEEIGAKQTKKKDDHILMQFKDIFLAWFIVIFFILIMVGNSINVSISEIKTSTGKNRCNPTSMFFADDGEDRMNECVTETSTVDYGKIMGTVFGLMSSVSDGIKMSVSDIGSMQSKLMDLKIANFDNITNAFGNFNTIFLHFQKIIAKIKDTLGKIIGIGTMFMYTVNGTQLLMMSIWNGELGDIIRGGEELLCFHPATPIPLDDGKIKQIKDIKIGDKLKNNNEVLATLEIKGNIKTDNYYYQLYSEELRENIFVTGSHFIQKDMKKTKVHQLKGAISTKGKGMETDKMYCLVTQTHFIDIGEHRFYDWET
jgi:hypothetical protein